MKWVVGGVAVLLAFVMGIAVGWLARAHQPVARAAATATVPAMPLPTYPHAPPPPIVTAPHVPTPWVEDDEKFAWPKTPATADIVAVDATHYRVRRSYIERILADQSNLMREVRIVPAYADGGARGIKMFGVRPTSVVAHLGMQNGDTLETINGVSLASPEDTLDAYTHMRTATKLVLALERRDAPLELHYIIEE